MKRKPTRLRETGARSGRFDGDVIPKRVHAACYPWEGVFPTRVFEGRGPKTGQSNYGPRRRAGGAAYHPHAAPPTSARRVRAGARGVRAVPARAAGAWRAAGAAQRQRNAKPSAAGQ